jgi:Tfp pilus assembly protein PilO
MLKISKREKIMLIALGVIILFTVGFIFIIQPQWQKLNEALVRYNEVANLRSTMQQMIANSQLQSDYQIQQENAKKNYDLLYTKLNAYSIDDIISEQLNVNSLTPISMSIGEYQNCSAQLLSQLMGYEFTDEQAKQEKLLICVVSLRIQGNYDSIINFLNGMNDKSFCLQTQTLSIKKSSEELWEGDFTLWLYGVQQPT